MESYTTCIPQPECQNVKVLRFYIIYRVELGFFVYPVLFPFALWSQEKTSSLFVLPSLYNTWPSLLPSCSRSQVSWALSLYLFFLHFTLHFYSFCCLYITCDLSNCLSLPFLFVFVYVSVSPVLTPPESEKADSEDRVSLKVCSQHFSLILAYFY